MRFVKLALAIAVAGILLVPSLTASIFSGQGGLSIVPGVPRMVRRF